MNKTCFVHVAQCVEELSRITTYSIKAESNIFAILLESLTEVHFVTLIYEAKMRIVNEMVLKTDAMLPIFWITLIQLSHNLNLFFT